MNVRKLFSVTLMSCALMGMTFLAQETAHAGYERGAVKNTLFVNLTTDDTWASQMAFNYARKVLGMGHPVVIFLNTRAVRLANRNIPHPRGGLSETPPQQALSDLIEKGVTVYVCPSCTKQAGMTQADWIRGVEAGGEETIRIQMNPTTQIMSY